MKWFKFSLTFIIFLLVVGLCFSHRGQQLAEDQESVEATGYWHYNDLDNAIAEATETGQPILVVFR